MMSGITLQTIANRLATCSLWVAALVLLLPVSTARATMLEDPPPDTAAAVLASEFNSCNVRQESLLSQLLLEAQLQLTSLTTELDDTFTDAASNGAPRFERWFGQFDGERFGLVRDIYRNILTATETQTISFDCRCIAYPNGGSVSAYVYGNLLYNINLCPNYWSQSTDWQRAILVHELSHFSVLGNTRDFSYGHFDTAQLAIDSPQDAVRNAEAYTLFFLNSPPIPMANPAIAPPAAVVLQLAAGASHDGTISKRQTALYGIEGASSVSLQPNNGADVDLHIYLGRERVCVSNRPGDQAETCELDPGLAYSAEVIPFTNDLAEEYLYTLLTSRDGQATARPDDEAQPVDGGAGGGGLASLPPLALSLFVAAGLRRRQYGKRGWRHGRIKRSPR
jgi:hypothetical protein